MDGICVSADQHSDCLLYTSSVAYKLIVTLVVDLNVFGANSANMMKLMCAVIVAVTLAVPAVRQYIQRGKLIKEARRDA